MSLAAPATRQVSSSTSITAPVGGLNALSPIPAMAETDAIVIRNFFPEAFGVRVRKGTHYQAIGLNGDVNSILYYVPQVGTTRIYAVDQSQIMDVTVPGDYSAGAPLCASTYSWWSHVNFANAAGTHMLALNGVDEGVLVSPDGLHRLIFGDGVVPYTIAGINPQLLLAPCVAHRRIWMVEKDSTKAWYLPPEAVYGVAKFFDFGANFSRGGHLQALVVYSQDSGLGPDDYLAAISSNGEVSMYAGIDPEDPDTWRQIGVYYIGPTFTRRCYTQYAGDIAILTQYGLVPLSSVAKPTNVSVLDNALSRKIQSLLSAVMTEGGYRSGWAIQMYPDANMLLINIPGINAASTTQLVLNTVTMAWTVFVDMPANCWSTVLGTLLFGTNGKVLRAWEGAQDNVDFDNENGVPIRADCQQAFSYFGTPGQNKHFKMLRPTFIQSGKFVYRAGANMAFDFTTIPPPAALSLASYGIWNVDLWNQAYWSGGAQSGKQWVFVRGISYAASVRIALEASTEVIWAATDWVFEKGGIAG